MSFIQSQLAATTLDQVSLNAIKYNIENGSKSGALPIALVAGAGAYYALSKSIQEKGLALSNGHWNVLSTISATIIGYAVWNESISDKQLAGIGLGVVSLYLMNGY